MNNSNVVYIYDHELRLFCDKLPNMKLRATLVQDLINAYDILKKSNTPIIKSIPATEDELLKFHVKEYISYIKNQSVLKCDNLEDMFGLNYDCPTMNNLYGCIKSVAGSSLTAAKILLKTHIKYAINWFGGWHHAQKNAAEGFCYVNDIVLCIIKLQEKFEKVLYVDLDVHHGNGVQNAFYSSNKVLTLSFHRESPGFYPGTGNINEIGIQNGEFFTINVPFKEYCGDETYLHLFNNIFKNVFDCFKPNALVVQCGADILSQDPLGECNVTLETMGKCIKNILDCDTPTIFLGGGGYNLPNTSRYWTYLTSVIVGKELAIDIPDESFYFTEYGPSYELPITKGNVKDCNSADYIKSVIEQINSYCDMIKQRVT